MSGEGGGGAGPRSPTLLQSALMRRWLLRLLVVAAIAAAVLAIRATLFAPDPVPVRVAPVERGRVEEVITNSRAGTVRARRRARLSPEIGGEVAELPHREGDRVEAGDLLLALDPTSQRARLLLARREADAAAAEARRACLAAERAERELERVRRLAESGIVSPDLLDEMESRERSAEATCAASRAQVERARAGVLTAEAELAKTRVHAPFPGVVAEVATEIGEWVTPAPPAVPVPPVLDLLDPGSIYVSAPMDEVDSARLATGQPARITVDSHRGESFPGRVVRVAPYVLDLEEQNRTVEVEAVFDDADFAATLLPGTSADLEVILDAREDVPRIPTETLLEGGRVLVVEDGTLAEREVETGLRNWTWTEVRSGVEPGDEVVVSLDRPEVEAGARVVVEGDATDGGGRAD